MAKRLLIRGAEVVVTMDGARREIAGGDVLVDGGVTMSVIATLPRPRDVDSVGPTPTRTARP